MPAKVIHTERIYFSSLTFLGKPGANWGQWWSNGWFDVLENLETKPVDPDYLGLIHGNDYWVGMVFPAGTNAPDGFEAIEIPFGDYALNYIFAKEDDRDLYGSTALQLCLDAMTAAGLKKRPGFIIERYNCPRFTTPDAQDNVILDYLIPIE